MTDRERHCCKIAAGVLPNTLPNAGPVAAGVLTRLMLAPETGDVARLRRYAEMFDQKHKPRQAALMRRAAAAIEREGKR